MAICLTDDGTMDTVIRCDACGKEYRFNFQTSDIEESRRENPPDEWIECGCCDCYHPPDFAGDCREDINRWPSKACIEQLDAQAYGDFVSDCITEIENEHVCSDEDNE